MVFFLLFLWSLLCGVWSNNANDPVVAQQTQQKMRVVVKMFFVMGVTWIAEFISWLLSYTIGSKHVYKIIFPFQVINSLQGLFMFLVIYFDQARIQKICGTTSSQRQPSEQSNAETRLSWKRLTSRLSTITFLSRASRQQSNSIELTAAKPKY